MEPPSPAEPPSAFDETDSPVKPGRSLIEASAGTGKTFALVALFIRLVLEGRKAPHLLVVTFTVAATEELTQRIREGLRAALAVFEGDPCPRPALVDLMQGFARHFGDSEKARRQCTERLRQALDEAADLSVFTIHGFCKHALEEWAFESGAAFRIDFAEEADDLLRRAAADCWHRRIATGDGRLAEAAVALDWSVEDMIEHLHKTRRHPGTRVVPDADLDDALGALGEALDDLQRAWDAEAMRERLDSVVWKKNAPLSDDDLPRRVRQVAACAEGRLTEGLDAARAFAPDPLREHANSRRTDRDHLDDTCDRDGPRACAAVVAAAERLERAVVHWFTDTVPRRFRTLKRRQRVMTFDDLLAELLRALDDPARGPALARAVRSRYDLALVDEFQDTDPRQYAIFKRIFSPPEGEEQPLFLIGDAKQAIYRFRGADLHTYLDARRESERRFTLERNWRSATPLVEAVNAVFEQAPAPFLHDDIPFRPVQAVGRPDDEPLSDPAGKAPLVWWYYPPKQKKAGRLKKVSKSNARPRITEATAGEIVRLLESGATIGERPLRAHDIAVLVRSNKQGKKMQAALRRAGVPAVVSARRNILDTREMAEIETLLRAVLEPRPDHIRAALATELWGRDARAIFDLKQNADRWAALQRRFEGWKDDWQTHGVAYLLARVLEEEDVRERLLSFADGERRLTNVRHCTELLHEAEQRRRQAPSGLLRWLARREEENILEGDETELRLESDERAVQVLTLHKSKGLEFNVVFCPFLWHTYFDEQQSPLVQPPGGDGVVYDIGSDERDEHLDLARAEQVAEEVRLAYVGLTRAVHRCYVVWGDLRSAPQSALGYLLHAGAAEGFDEADTPAERAAAARRAAKQAQTRTAAPNRLRRLFGDCASIAVEYLDDVEHQAERWAEAQQTAPASGDDASPLRARTLDGRLDGRLAPWTYASYSSWTQDEGPSTPHPQQPPEEDDEDEPEGVFAFASGLRAGRCLHDILERVDFSADPGAEQNARQVRRLLRRHRLDDSERHRASRLDPEGVVRDLLGTLRATDLPGVSFTLADVAWAQASAEWSFSLPTGRAGPRDLRPAFDQSESALAQDYAPHLDDLDDAGGARGFLRGCADLLFEHDGRYYLIDWKSNLLGETPEAYAHARLRETMIERHYVLQYHLYAAALQRHLKRRRPDGGGDYDHQQHFGGVGYVFLRGLQPDAATGLFFDRPSDPLLTAINRRLDGPENGGPQTAG